MERDWDAPSAVDFFQHVRSLERQLWSNRATAAEAGSQVDAAGIGEWGDYAEEPIHFRAANSLAYPTNAVVAIHAQMANPAKPFWLMDVAFMGLVGPMGVLPPHLTSLLLGEGDAARPSLRDFFALFEHRFISRFYRAWELSHILFGLERSVRQDDDDNAHGFTLAIRSLTGLGSRSLSQRLQFSDRLPAFYAGVFSNLIRPAENLAKIIEAALLVPCNVVEFVSEWQTIAPRQRTRLGPGAGLEQSNNRLGASACVGSRVWTVQDRFCVQLGPLDYPTFVRFSPAGDRFPLLCDLVRLYAGTELAFDIQPILQANAVPPSQLRSQPNATTRLGWNSWLTSRPFERPAADAVFASSG